MIGGIKKSVGFNHERHTIKCPLKIILSMNIFARQGVGMYG